jgi:5'-nucleotidase
LKQRFADILTAIDKIRNIRAVLFDVDDTLFDRKRAQPLVLERIVKQLPEIFQNLEKERITTAFIESDLVTIKEFDAGAPSEGLRDVRSRLFLRSLGIHENYADTITAIYVQEYPAVNAAVPGARDIVNQLGKNYATGVVSNGFPDVQYTKLETIGLKQAFSCIVLSEEIGIRKPNPGIFQHAISLLKVQPGECLYVGDSYANDVIGAASAGMKTCWLNRDSAEPEVEDIDADFMISDLAELNALLMHK